LTLAENREGCCRLCGSEAIVKIGKIQTKHGAVQWYLCHNCNHKFVVNETGFEYVKATPKAITTVLDCYFKGMSQRKIVEHLKVIEGIAVTQPCIVKWIQKYIELMKSYLDKFTPNLGGIWHSDEVLEHVRKKEPIKVRGKDERTTKDTTLRSGMSWITKPAFS
jgi:transposase-like protein